MSNISTGLSLAWSSEELKYSALQGWHGCDMCKNRYVFIASGSSFYKNLEAISCCVSNKLVLIKMNTFIWENADGIKRLKWWKIQYKLNYLDSLSSAGHLQN